MTPVNPEVIAPKVITLAATRAAMAIWVKVRFDAI
jgi:hypothetical protein